VLRTAALQAKADLSDADAALLISSFEAYKITLPCPKCRAHYVTDWVSFPFTLTEAKSPQLAMKWVEDLRIRIEVRVKAERDTEASAARAATAAATVRTRPSPSVLPPTAPTAAVAPLAKPRRVAAPAAIPIRSDAATRQIAIQSAVQQTVKRPGGCNCGRRR